MSRRQKAKQLTKALLKVSRGQSWDCYVCDESLFFEKNDAIDYAHQLAELREQTTHVYSVKIPTWLWLKPIGGYGALPKPKEAAPTEGTEELKVAESDSSVTD